MHLERLLGREFGATYQRRNYNARAPLVLDGLTTHGFTVDNNDLRHVVASDEATDDLFVLTLGVKSTTRYC